MPHLMDKMPHRKIDRKVYFQKNKLYFLWFYRKVEHILKRGTFGFKKFNL